MTSTAVVEAPPKKVVSTENIPIIPDELDPRVFNRYWDMYRQRHGPTRNHPAEFWNQCIESKEQLIQFLGGSITLSLPISSFPSPLAYLDRVVQEKAKERFATVKPETVKKLNLNSKVFPYLDVLESFDNLPDWCLPSKWDSLRTSVTRTIQRKALNFEKMLDDPSLGTEQDRFCIDLLCRFVSDVSTLTSCYNTWGICGEDARLVITGNPATTTSLGHLSRYDRGSCYRAGGCNHSHPFSVAISPNAFTTLLVHGPENKPEVISRAWGCFFYNKKMPFLYTTNFYSEDGTGASIHRLLLLWAMRKLTSEKDENPFDFTPEEIEQYGSLIRTTPGGDRDRRLTGKCFHPLKKEFITGSQPMKSDNVPDSVLPYTNGDGFVCPPMQWLKSDKPCAVDLVYTWKTPNVMGPDTTVRHRRDTPMPTKPTKYARPNGEVLDLPTTIEEEL